MSKWVWIIGGMVALGALVTVCSVQAVNLFGFLTERQAVAAEFVEHFGNDPIAAIETEPLSELIEDGTGSFDQLIGLMPRLGAFGEIAETSCNWNTYTGTERLNGEFIDCQGQASFEHDSTVGFTLGWRKEEATWKLYAFRLRSERFLADVPPQTERSDPVPAKKSKD